MPADENKALVRRYFAAMNAGDLEGLGTLVSPSYVDHSSAPGSPAGLDGARQSLAMVRGAFPDAHWDIEDMLAEGDRVAVRVTFRGTQRGAFLDIPATGRTAAMQAMAIIRVSEGKLQESWINRDRLALMQQLRG